ncbi:protein NLRC5-like [Amphiura filiformis]|uniref:protein NLRC5-like n=1 Tax=Amphiura filiformis TaxID=82378 RepID=UPI003B2160C9
MRDFDQDMSLVDAIFDQLLPSDSKVSRRGLEKYIVENTEKVAVILDGADEFSGKIERSPQGNLVMDVVCNKMMCNSCVVVTTRPHKVDTVSVFSQYSHVRVIGFGERSMLEFIGKFFQVKTFASGKEVHEHVFPKSEFKDKTEALEHDIKDIEAESAGSESNFEGSISKTKTAERKKSVDVFITTIFRSRDLLPMSFVPVILTMLCLLWGEAQKLPTRFTTLYQEMFHYFIQRWYEKSDDCTDSEEFEKGILWRLGEVALKCLFEGRLHFTAGELKSTVIIEQSRSIGFIKEETKRSKLRLVKQYSFFHMSFQEFCAAVYWTSLADVSDVKFMDYLHRVNSDNVESFEYVLLFCCGLSTLAASHILSHLVDICSSDVTDGKHCEFDLFHGCLG